MALDSFKALHRPDPADAGELVAPHPLAVTHQGPASPARAAAGIRWLAASTPALFKMNAFALVGERMPKSL
jgi:hypothetical protein